MEDPPPEYANGYYDEAVEQLREREYPSLKGAFCYCFQRTGWVSGWLTVELSFQMSPTSTTPAQLSARNP